MSLTFNVMENDVLRPLFMKAQMDSERDGEAKVLTRQLKLRFGTVPEWASEKLTNASLSSLEEWTERILDAQSLDDVFSDKP